MFCNKCQAFLQSFFLASKTCNSADTNSSMTWAHHETVLHRSMRELRTSSDALCPICRSILATPTHWELRDLLSSSDEVINIVLEADAKHAAFPTLYISFDAGKVGKLPRRMLAACEGYLEDGG
ncbi:hypothetical protein BU23DRAFT_561587 [Bimuria novae-zelandiae CBS 107.79]|uniref:Uncharacterized protein n=1 Tax=Bimuria novae-zelandiae CBS 107.79 TaxID=1447943 RepID=A0A6A5UJ35_9PLEO|nr:hypothetical protein BU23DRAFT_561587 [Bimuria novae-zelandiae CBS 107.79]